MQLTRHTDYALRLLIFLAGKAGERVSIADVAAAHKISRSHLMKVANHLAHLGFVETVRGRGGGITLARPAAEINLGAVITGTEPDNDLVNCGSCGIVGACRLPSIFDEGLDAFHTVLAKYSLADLTTGKVRL
jgi:Rrf2 family nitric oxide-sensitive transcriptional repressor